MTTVPTSTPVVSTGSRPLPSRDGDPESNYDADFAPAQIVIGTEFVEVDWSGSEAGIASRLTAAWMADHPDAKDAALLVAELLVDAQKMGFQIELMSGILWCANRWTNAQIPLPLSLAPPPAAPVEAPSVPRPRSAVHDETVSSPWREGHPGWIYYARVQGHIKIGYTQQTVLQRMNGYPPGSELLACHPGSRSQEAEIHREMDDHLSAHREWFAETPEVMAKVQDVLDQYGPPPEMPAALPKRRGSRPAVRPANREMVGTPMLKRRGWTDSMVRDYLGAADCVSGHKLHEKWPGMRLYLQARVEAAELSPEVQRRLRKVT